MWEIWRSRQALTTKHRTNRQDGTQSPVESGTPLGRIASATVNFKDLSIRAELHDGADGEDDDADRHSEDSTNKGAILSKAPNSKYRPDRTKYIIILVGLPGRGKTFLCNKLKCYLNWLGHNTRHFNVGSYRRLQKGDHEVQNADFFDAHNTAGLEARNRALYAALEDLQSYLYSPEGQVAIFDATNTTEERRRLLIRAFHGRFQYLFIESICTDEKVLEQNYRFKMQYSPDYRGMDMHQSLYDFKERIHKYEEVYEPILDRNIHYIKLIDMVTGRGHMDVNRISGYLPGKIVFFLMQVCKAGMAQARRIWLTRHGESEFNLSNRIGGNSGLASSGEVYARCLPDMLIERLPHTSDDDSSFVPVSVWTSTLCRTIQTARYLPFPKLRWKALDEIQAGACDGLTYDEIEQRFPDEFAARAKDKLRYRYPAGESYLDVIQRLEPVIIEMEREKECIVVVGHQAVLRAVLGYFMAKPLESIPTLDIPLHTLVELRPRPDGTMDFDYVPMPAEAAASVQASMALEAAASVGAGAPHGRLPLGLGPLGMGAYPVGGLGGGFGLYSSGGSFSSAVQSPLMSPIYSMGRLGHDVVQSAPLPPVILRTVADVAAEEVPSEPLMGPAAVPTPLMASAVSAERRPPPIATAAEAAAVDDSTAEAWTAGTGASLSPNDMAAFTNVDSPAVKHSRVPSLASGIASAALAAAAATAAVAGASAASTPLLGSSPAASAGSFLFAVTPGSAGGVESPSALSASRAAAMADAASRTRPVRVPFGATMGGGGSEGGAPPSDVCGSAGHPPAAPSLQYRPQHQHPTPQAQPGPLMTMFGSPQCPGELEAEAEAVHGEASRQERTPELDAQ